MKIRELLITIATCYLLIVVPLADAQTVDKNKTEVTKINEKVSVEVYGGYLSGQSRELVFDSATGHKNSELFWKIDGAFVLGGTIAVCPVEWLTLKIGGWTPVKSNNTMDDYDWLKSGEADWSDWSNHPDTKMNRGHMINAGVAARMVKFDKTSWFNSAQLDLLVGYRWFYMNWTSSGGTYIHSSETGFRDDVGTFQDGVAVIAYEQWIETPYIGIGGSMNIDRWSFSGDLTGSLWSRASDRDNHYLRTILFEDNFKNMPMIGVEVKASYAMTNHLSLFGSFMYQKYFETKGSSTMNNYTTGEFSSDPGDAAGMDHYSMLFNLGLKLAF
jgi:outer membrane protease